MNLKYILVRYFWVGILLFLCVLPAVAQGNLIEIQPTTGLPGSTVVIRDLGGNRGKTCFMSFNNEATPIGNMAGSITVVIPTVAQPGSTIGFICTGGRDGLRSNMVTFTVAGGITPTPVILTLSDSDSDGIVDVADACPTVAGIPEQNGCPSSQPDPGDSDGDGIFDYADACPSVAGIPELNGCPLTIAPEPPPVVVDPPHTLPDLPTSGACVLATIDADMVNIRQDTSTDTPIVGQISPLQTYPVIGRNADSSWFQIEGGWVAGFVTRRGGDCSALADGTSNTIMVAEVMNTGLLVPAVQNIRDAAARLQNCPNLLPAVDALPNFLTLYVLGEPDPCAAAQAELDGLFLSAGQATRYADGIDIEYLFDDCTDFYGYVPQFLQFMETLHYYDEETWQFIVDMLTSQHQFACNFAYELWNFKHIPENLPDQYALPFAVTYCIGEGMSHAWFDKVVGFLNLLGMTRENVDSFYMVGPDGSSSDCDLIHFVQPVGFVTTGNMLFFQLLNDTCEQTPNYASERAFLVAIRGGFDAGAAANESCAGDALLESLMLPGDLLPLLPRIADEVANCDGAYRLLATYNPALGLETLYTILKSIDPCAAAENYAYWGSFSAPTVPSPECVQGSQLVIEGSNPAQGDLVLDPTSSWRDKIRYLDRPVDEICTRLDADAGNFQINPTATLPQFAIEPTPTPPILVIEPIEPSATPLGLALVLTPVVPPVGDPPLGDPPVEPPAEQPAAVPPVDPPSSGQGSGANEMNLNNTSGSQFIPDPNSGALGVFLATDAEGRFNGAYLLTNVRHIATDTSQSSVPFAFDPSVGALLDTFPVSLSPDGQYLTYFVQGDPAAQTEQTRQITVIPDTQTDAPVREHISFVYQKIIWTLAADGGYTAVPAPDQSVILNFAAGLIPAPYAPLSMPETGAQVLVLFENGSTNPSIFRLTFNQQTNAALAQKLVENAAAPAVSPNGRFLAFERMDASGRNLYVMSVSSGEIHPITQQQGSECYAPQFGSDSLTLFFTCEAGGERKIFRYGLAGVSELAVGTPNAGNPMPANTPGFITFDDGQKIYIAREDGSQVATLMDFEFDGLSLSQMTWIQSPPDGTTSARFYGGRWIFRQGHGG